MEPIEIILLLFVNIIFTSYCTDFFIEFWISFIILEGENRFYITIENCSNEVIECSGESNQLRLYILKHDNIVLKEVTFFLYDIRYKYSFVLM